ncbi:hypothetical protein [Brenneria goodwinii]|nr:hypothetical protein [Brenneria goodwinii]
MPLLLFIFFALIQILDLICHSNAIGFHQDQNGDNAARKASTLNAE